MRKLIYIIYSVLLLLLAVGCGGSEAETAVPTPPTDANTDTQAVATKPQLIEFYANW